MHLPDSIPLLRQRIHGTVATQGPSNQPNPLTDTLSGSWVVCSRRKKDCAERRTVLSADPYPRWPSQPAGRGCLAVLDFEARLRSVVVLRIHLMTAGVVREPPTVSEAGIMRVWAHDEDQRVYVLGRTSGTRTRQHPCICILAPSSLVL